MTPPSSRPGPPSGRSYPGPISASQPGPSPSPATPSRPRPKHVPLESLSEYHRLLQTNRAGAHAAWPQQQQQQQQRQPRSQQRQPQQQQPHNSPAARIRPALKTTRYRDDQDDILMDGYPACEAQEVLLPDSDSDLSDSDADDTRPTPVWHCTLAPSPPCTVLVDDQLDRTSTSSFIFDRLKRSVRSRASSIVSLRKLRSTSTLDLAALPSLPPIQPNHHGSHQLFPPDSAPANPAAAAVSKEKARKRLNRHALVYQQPSSPSRPFPSSLRIRPGRRGSSSAAQPDEIAHIILNPDDPFCAASRVDSAAPTPTAELFDLSPDRHRPGTAQTTASTAASDRTEPADSAILSPDANEWASMDSVSDKRSSSRLSVSTVDTTLSAQWYQTPQQRLGLGGRVWKADQVEPFGLADGGGASQKRGMGLLGFAVRALRS